MERKVAKERSRRYKNTGGSKSEVSGQPAKAW